MDKRRVTEAYGTEVGMSTEPSLPEGWTVRSLRSCLRAAPAYGINAAAVPFDDGLPTYLRITDISDDNRFRPSPRVSIEHPNASAFFLNEGDLVFARTGASVGKSYLYDPADGPLVFAGFLIRVSSNPEDVKPEFLTYCVQSERYWDWVATMSSRSGQPGINGQEYGMFRFLLPPSDEQRIIAEALSDVDSLLRSLEELIAKKRAVKQAAMQQLLTGKTRMPGFSGEWETRRLGELVDIDPENLPVNTNPDYEFNYISLEQVETGRLRNYTVEIFRTSPSRARRRLRHNDVLMSTVRPNLMGHFLFNEQFTNAVCSTGFAVLRYKRNLSVPGFLFFHLFGPVVNRWINRTLAGSNYPAISSQDVALIEIPCPSTVREQAAIAAVLSDMDAEIAALERRLDKIRAVKQGMMQQLLTGKIRLVESVEATTRQISTASKVKKHNWQFNESVVISVLARRFGNEQYPLNRTRYTKLSYLLHRYTEGRAEGYLKKAAGPYHPRTRHRGPETIALKNGYVRRHENGDYGGFIAGKNIEKAESYFAKWYEEDILNWLDQFRYEKRDDLELLTTVDLAVEELREAGKTISVEGVRKVIHSDPEWIAKLNRSIFSNTNVARAIEKCRRLFGVGDERSKA